MNFLVDAQLPRRVARWLRTAGHDAIHTSELPNGNRTTDSEINDLAEREQQIVIAKDADFVNSFVLSGKPAKLLLVSTGNISNADLESLFAQALPGIVTDFRSHTFIELNRAGYVVHV
jgi:predicted nuclease of predicted toxin-antitoxin system